MSKFMFIIFLDILWSSLLVQFYAGFYDVYFFFGLAVIKMLSRSSLFCVCFKTYHRFQSAIVMDFSLCFGV